MSKKDLIGKKAQPIPVEPQEIGIDIDDALIDAIIEGVDNDAVDITSLDTFANVTQSRENVYQLIDAMASDDRVSAILETFTEDCVETNDKGQVVWCESSDEDVGKYVGYLLDVLNVDKNAYEWMYSLLRYGDVYLRLYRQSDYKREEDFLFKEEGKEKKQLHEGLFDNLDDEEPEQLNEDVNVSMHDVDDHYEQYVEMVSNPGEMFELTKFGKTVAYISAPCNIQDVQDYTTQLSNYLTYKLKKKDVTVYGATDFVHASLRNSNNLRNPEEVKIFKDDKDYENNSNAGSYKVKRGQSILYNKFKIWRQLCLTENSILMDRVTKSALIRLIQVQTTGMPKNKIPEYLSRLKSKIEQKIAMSVDSGSMSNYTNPGPLINTIITPVTDTGQGTISIQNIGENYDPKSLTDLDNWQTRFYGSFRAPKAYFNLTDDGAGFNGGQSLAILSSRYGKAVKQYQNTFCQMITDLINLFLIDSGYENFINKFTIRMQTPVTQEEIDRRDNLRNRIGVINDVMNQVGGVDIDELTKLKLYKELLAGSITDPTVIALIQERIDTLEKEQEEKNIEENEKNSNKEIPSEERKESPTREFEKEIGFEETEEETPEVEETPEEEGGESYLPSPEEIGIDLTGNE